jgi:hypothetical protein
MRRGADLQSLKLEYSKSRSSLSASGRESLVLLDLSKNHFVLRYIGRHEPAPRMSNDKSTRYAIQNTNRQCPES